MTKQDVKSRAKALETILDAERDALLHGDFGNLPKIAAEKEAAFGLFAQSDPAEKTRCIAIIEAKVQRNAQLLEAARKGFEQAKSRIADIRGAIGHLKTYDGRGQVSSRHTGGPSVSFKA